MKKIFLRISCLVLLFVFAFSTASIANAASSTEYTSGYYTYTVSNGKAEICDFDDTIGGNITIPSTLGGYPVTSIGSFAFYHCDSLNTVTLPNGLTNIGGNAFSWCSSLSKITIPNTVISIGSSAFSNCESLASITLPNNLTNISNELFYYCKSITAITIPSGITSIGNHAFYNCSALTKITIPDSLINIGEMAFGSCKSLTKITIPNNVVSIGAYAFNGCSSLANINIPESVISIGENTFGGCTSITKIVIPESITNLNNMLFAGCSSLTQITIPDSVIQIGDSVFSGCSSLKNIKIPDSVLRLGDYVFSSCDSLSDIVIPENITSIGESAFWCCRNLKSVVIPNSVVSIGKYAFNHDCISLSDIYYTGTEKEWNNITINEYNEGLLNATIHYNYNPSHSHSYVSSVTTAATCTKSGVKTYTCECGDSYTETIPSTGHTSGDWQIVHEATAEKEGKKIQKCTVCSETIAEVTIPKLDNTTENKPIVKKPSQTTIRYGDSIILHANTADIPAGATIKWTSNNNNFDMNVSSDGYSCEITPNSSGTTTFTVSVIDSDGNILSTDEQSMTSKAGFFDKIIAFFKGIFGLNKTYAE